MCKTGHLLHYFPKIFFKINLDMQSVTIIFSEFVTINHHTNTL